jgi:hypothetical protein
MTGINCSRKPTRQEPYILSRVVYSALGPFEQLAAKALEKCGKVKIVENSDDGDPG